MVNWKKKAFGHGRSCFKVLSRQLHFRDLLAGHDRRDGALRYAGLRATSANGRAIFPMCYGIQFRYPPRYANGPTARYMFDMRCRENGIEHRFGKINHPWMNGQVERMNLTIKDATVSRQAGPSRSAILTTSSAGPHRLR